MSVVQCTIRNIRVFEERFDWLFGAGTLDSNFDEAMVELSQVDEKLWS